MTTLSDKDLALCRLYAMDNTPVFLGIVVVFLGTFLYNNMIAITISVISNIMDNSTWIIV